MTIDTDVKESVTVKLGTLDSSGPEHYVLTELILNETSPDKVRAGLVFLHSMQEAKARIAVSKVLKEYDLGGTRGKINNKVLVTHIRNNMNQATGNPEAKINFSKSISKEVGGTYKTILGILGSLDFAKEYAIQELAARDIATMTANADTDNKTASVPDTTKRTQKRK